MISSYSTLREMVDEIMAFTVGSDSSTEEIARSWVNKHYEKFGMARDWKSLRGLITAGLTTVAGQAYLSLPEDCALPIKITDRSQDWALVPLDHEQLREDYVHLIDTSGTPVIHYSPVGPSATIRPLSSAAIVVVSAEKETDVEVEVSISGLRDDPDILDKEILVTDSTSAATVEAEGTITWREGWSIHSISTASDLDGYIEVREANSAGNVLAYLSEHNRSSKHFIIQLQNDPNAANTLELIYKKKIIALIDDNDAPVIPVSSAIVEASIGSIRRLDEQYTQGREHDRQAQTYLASAIAQETGQARTSHRTRPAAAKFRRDYRGY